MKFDINEYIKTNLSPNAYIILYGILTEDVTLKNHLNTVVFDIREELIELQSKGYIKLLGDDLSYEIRKKGLDLKESEVKEVEFNTFWDKYHKVTGLKKTDLKAALGYWKKLSKQNKLLALSNIQDYYDSLPIYTTGKPVKKARTYLNDQNFLDQFEIKEKKKSLNKMI